MPRGRRPQAPQPVQPQLSSATETPSLPVPAAQPATQPAAVTRSSHSRNPPDNDGEFFDLEVSDSDASDNSDDDQANGPQARRTRSEPAANLPNIQVNDPTPATKKGTTALDIEYFYDRQKGRDTFCKECK